MAPLPELREHVQEAHQRLARAIDATADSWEELREGEWSPREMAQHAMELDLKFATAITRAAGLAPPDRRSFEFATAAAAGAELRGIDQAVATVLTQLVARDLGKSSAVLGSVYGTLVLTAHHLNLRALQMQGL